MVLRSKMITQGYMLYNLLLLLPIYDPAYTHTQCVYMYTSIDTCIIYIYLTLKRHVLKHPILSGGKAQIQPHHTM